MSDLVPVSNEITKKDIRKDRLLKTSAVALPFVGAALPSIFFFVLFLLSSTTPAAGMFGILSLLSLAAGFIVGGIGSAATMVFRSRWLGRVRERVAISGIKAKDVEWFKNEMKSEEKKALKDIKTKNLLLADAYQETLASRLTATRILKSTKHELLLAKRRKNKLKYLKSERVDEFKAEVEKDIGNLQNIKTEADEMLVEAESRLQMIDAASRRGNELAGNELALKKLSARSEQLPLALETAKHEEETRKELVDEIEAELNKDSKDIELLED